MNWAFITGIAINDRHYTSTHRSSNLVRRANTALYDVLPFRDHSLLRILDWTGIKASAAEFAPHTLPSRVNKYLPPQLSALYTVASLPVNRSLTSQWPVSPLPLWGFQALPTLPVNPFLYTAG